MINFANFLQSCVLPLNRKLQNLSESVEASSGLDSFGTFLIKQKSIENKFFAVFQLYQSPQKAFAPTAQNTLIIIVFYQAKAPNGAKSV